MISIILPTFNECLNIETLITDIIDTLQIDFEVIVVDDNSPDGTHSVVENMAMHDSRIRCIRRTSERGLSKSIQEGVDAARGDLIGWMDADLSMPARYLKIMSESVINEDFDVVIASRFVPDGINEGDSSLARFSSFCLSMLGRYIFRFPVRDITSGYILAKRFVFDNLRLKGNYGEYFIYLVHQLAHRGHRIAEIPYTPLPRRFGDSKTNPSFMTFLLRGMNYLTMLLRIHISN